MLSSQIILTQTLAFVCSWCCAQIRLTWCCTRWLRAGLSGSMTQRLKRTATCTLLHGVWDQSESLTIQWTRFDIVQWNAE